jgi:integrase
MPTIRERNGRWQVQVRLKGFQRTESMPEGTTKEEAREWGLERKRDFKLGQVPTLARKRLQLWTLELLIERYQRELQIGQLTSNFLHGRRIKRSARNENVMLGAFKKGSREPYSNVISRKTLDQITTKDFEIYRDRRFAAGTKASTVRRELNPLRTIYKIARRNREIPAGDPFKDLYLPPEDNAREIVATPEQRSQLLEATLKFRSPQQGYLWRALIIAALTTAMRRGELLKLRWVDVDFEKLSLTVRYETTKSWKTRILPMSKLLRDNLMEYKDAIRDEKTTPTCLVFPLSASALEQAWQRLCTNAGIDYHQLHFHDLKHTALTNFGEKPIGLFARELAYMAAHGQGTITDRYLHLEMVESIRAKLDVDYQERYSQTVPEVEAYPLAQWVRDVEKAPYHITIYKHDGFENLVIDPSLPQDERFNHLPILCNVDFEEAAKLFNMSVLSMASLIQSGPCGSNNYIAVLHAPYVPSVERLAS